MKPELRLLIVETSPADTEGLLQALRSQGFTVAATTAGSPEALRAVLGTTDCNVILCGHPVAACPAVAALAIAKELRPDVPFIIVSAQADLNLAIGLIKLGAHDYVKSQELIRLGPVIERELRDAELRRNQHITENKLHESRALFRAIVENVGDLVAVLDTEGRRVYNNPAYAALFRERDIREGSTSFAEIHPEDRERIRSVFRKTVETGIGECAEFRFVLKDGSIRFMESDGRAIRDAGGRVSKVVVVSRDITEQKRLEAELREMAATDMLTGLPNRRHFIGQLEQETARVHRDGEHSASVLMIDIDHFKRINDSCGHVAGDQVLRHLATVMRQELRRIDTLGRIGGEEFAIILPGAGLADAELFADRLRRKVAETVVTHEGHELPVTISIGVSAIHPADSSADDVLGRADRALYCAKEGGRNRVVVEA
ncbi:MAG: diguanylate cyclase [Burkholderiales bacterium]|nr:diguanylate cyclase [Burkholderiales bacterium]